MNSCLERVRDMLWKVELAFSRWICSFARKREAFNLNFQLILFEYRVYLVSIARNFPLRKILIFLNIV